MDRNYQPKGFVHQPRVGVLVANTGTPDAPTPAALRSFLTEFLSDQRVVDLPRWIWLPILYTIILSVRPRRAAQRYRKIWTQEGSPLAVSTKSIADGLEVLLQEPDSLPISVVAGMRYGRPSIADGLRVLWRQGVDRLLILPLYPQYTTATTASVFDAVFEEVRRCRWMLEIRTLTSYHAHPAYIGAVTKGIQEHWKRVGKAERLLFSFHGVPSRRVERGDPYKLQCHETASLVARQLDLDPGGYHVAFQSRFGPQEWLRPYTEDVLRAWGRETLGSVDVSCPGFSSDCLETLYGIKEEASQIFKQAGGGEFYYVPALDDHASHIQALAEIIRPQLRGWLDENGGLANYHS